MIAPGARIIIRTGPVTLTVMMMATQRWTWRDGEGRRACLWAIVEIGPWSEFLTEARQDIIIRR